MKPQTHDDRSTHDDPSMKDTPSSRPGRRLALVIHALYGGGAERLMSQLASRWAELWHDVHLITLAHRDSDKYPISQGIARHALDLMRPSRGMIDGIRANRQRIGSLRKTLVEVQPELVLSFCDRMNIVTASACAQLQVPLWLAEHSDPAQQRLGFLWELARGTAYRRLSRRPNCGCVVLNSKIADGMRRRFPNLHLKIIPPAIDPPSVMPTKKTRADGQQSVLTLGRHSREKNLPAMLDAWQQVAKEFPNWRLVMAGDGPEHQALRDQAQRLSIGASVDFPGWINDPWPWLAEADLFALPSHYEGFPVSLLEAMTCGVACMSTDVFGEAARFFQADAVERIAQPQADCIADALRRLIGDAARRQHLATTGQKLAREFSWSTIGPKWDALLTSHHNLEA